LPAAYGETAGKVITRMVKPLMADPFKHGYLSGLFAAMDPEMVEGEGVHGQYIMPDKKISEVSKKGQDVVMAVRLWDLRIRLLKEKVGTLDYGFRR
jgi:WW domain-containing oxidoreductase